MEWLLKKSGFATQAEAPAIIRNNGGSGHQSSTGLLVGVGVGGGGISASISSPVKLTGQDLAIEKKQIPLAKKIIEQLNQAFQLRNEAEKNTTFEAILTEFCAKFSEQSIFNARESLNDLTKIITFLCIRLSTGIQHQIDKNEELLSTLSSHQLCTINALDLVSKVDRDAIYDVLSQGNISVILMRVFSSLAHSSFNCNLVEESKQMGVLLGDILIRLSRQHHTATSISIPDLVDVVICRYTSSSPTTTSFSSPNTKMNNSPTSIIWKGKAVEIMESGLLEYISEKDITVIEQKKMMKHLTELMAECADRHDAAAGIVFMKTCALLLKATTERSVFTLFDIFASQKGYECILSLLGCCIDENSVSYNEMWECYAMFLVLGKDNLNVRIPEQPVQLKGFKFPDVQHGAPHKIKNLTVLDVIVDLNKSVYYKLPKSRKSFDPLFRPSDEALEYAQRKSLDILLRLLSECKINFFIIDQHNILFQLIQNLASVPASVQRKILDVCEFVTISLNFLPFKEFVFLLPYLHNNDTEESRETEKNVCQLFHRILSQQPIEFSSAFREAGLQNTLTESIAEGLANLKELDETLPVFANFELKLDLVDLMTNSDYENVALFKKTAATSVFELIKLNKFRTQALKIVKTLIRESIHQGSKEIIELTRLIEIVQSASRSQFELKHNVLLTIKEALTFSQCARTSFRENGGFMAILSILLTLENVFTHPPSLSSQPSTVANNDETGKIETAVTEVAPFATFQYPDTTTTNIKDTPLENNQHEQELAQYNQLMRDIFEMLIIAIRENEASRKFLIEQIGIHTIQDSIKLSGILSTKYCKTAFGGMFGLALESIEVTDLFEEGGNVGRQLLSNRNTTLVSAGFLLNIIKLIPLCSKISPESVIGAILALSHANKHNQVQIYNSGALFTLFSWLFNNNESWILASCANDEVKLASHPSYKIIKELTNRLIEVGISNVELRHLFQRFDISHFRPDEKTNVRLMEVILHGLSRGRSPAYFSMALDRHCSIWMNDFGRTFPPQGGYTFMMWFQVEKFDTTAPDDGQSLKKPNIPIFGIVDDEERIRLNISLDSIQQQLHIQTYKAEVSVSGFKFEQGEWYHIAIVHQKPRISASYADVFVNGTMIEHTRCPYLGHPGSAKHVRSYFGYPPDQKINGNQTSILNIGSAYFIEEILFEAKEVSSIYYLGFDYYSNFQGSLTKYRTNESMHQILVDGGRFNDAQRENNPGDMTMLSMILPFQMSSNSSFLPEDKVLVAIHPHNHLGVVLNDYSNESNSTLYQTAAKFASLKAVFNSSIPKLKDESEVVSTLANIKGNVLVVCPERLIDGLWKIGGCSILLKLIETSQSSDSLYMSCAILTESLKCNWRSIEEMERNSLYEVLAHILKAKQHLLTRSVMNILLELVGKSRSDTEYAVIGNVLAYRHLFLEFELWQKDHEMQQCHLQQFEYFIKDNEKSDFNLKRLHRMGILKRLMVAVKDQVFLSDLIPKAFALMKVLLDSNFTGESIRSVCTFLVSTLPKDTEIKQKACGNTNPFSDIPRIITNSKLEDTPSHTIHIRNGLLEMLFDILCGSSSNSKTKIFLSNITTRWIMLFFDRNIHPHTAVLASRILARLMYDQDVMYTERMKEGFVVLSNLLCSYSHIHQIYHSLFAILCGVDVSLVSIDSKLDLPTLTSLFGPDSSSKKRSMCPDVLIVILRMLKQSMSHLVLVNEKCISDPPPAAATSSATTTDTNIASSSNLPLENSTEYANCKLIVEGLTTIVHFLSICYKNSDDIKEGLCSIEVMEKLIDVMIMTLFDDNSVLTPAFELAAVADIVESENYQIFSFAAKTPDAALLPESIVLHPLLEESQLSEDKQDPVGTWTTLQLKIFDLNAALFKDIRSGFGNLLVDVCLDSIFGTWRPLRALEVFTKSLPHAKAEVQIQFQTYILHHVMQSINATFCQRRSLYTDTKVISNIAKLSTLLIDRIYLGFFPGGHLTVLDFVSQNIQSAVLELEANGGKLDSNFTSFFRQFNRIVFLCLGHYSIRHKISGDDSILRFLANLETFEKALFHAGNLDIDFFKSILHYIYTFISGSNENLRQSTIWMWKAIGTQKASILAASLKSTKAPENRDLIEGFTRVLETDEENIINWINKKKEEIQPLFTENATKTCDLYLHTEQRLAKEGLRVIVNKRFTKLKKIVKRQVVETETFKKYVTKTRKWILDIQKLESTRNYLQRQNDNTMVTVVDDKWKKLAQDLIRERSIWGPENDKTSRWKLDHTEGRSRMRKKMVRNVNAGPQYISKSEKLRKQSVDIMLSHSFKDSNEVTDLNSSFNIPAIKEESVGGVSATTTLTATGIAIEVQREVFGSVPPAKSPEPPAETDSDDEAAYGEQERGKAQSNPDEEDFTFIDDEASKQDQSLNNSSRNTAEGEVSSTEQQEEQEAYEQENKITRLIDAGDVIIEGFNVARIVGLDVYEGVVLIGKDSIYSIDSYFKRSDGEYVDIDNAPDKERNVYNLMLTESRDSKVSDENSNSEGRYSTRKWSCNDMSEIFNRLFLLRSVALEIFLLDGRSFFLSFADTKTRDAVYNKLVTKITSSGTGSSGEKITGIGADAGISSRLKQNFLGVSPLNDLTQKWCQREISNFEYLIRLNSWAGRSYNDLTQYPVFPWILKDYESEELNLEDPNVYRDLSKPMGAQGSERMEKFEERFQLCDDPNTPASHYSVHYSSAMIVCSYLIRLEPFTQQYLKLQGGHFDHPDRLFQSVGHSWTSASELNMADVRELTPEFFYLPELFTNHNKFNFGINQKGEVIDDIILPPWAKSNPRLFIQKHREALESEYVSSHLNEWIDLIFGYKQQGEEAQKAVNLFHYLSYEGAVDIDSIEDSVQKQATIGIINNFGQTPRQLFKKSHPKRNPLETTSNVPMITTSLNSADSSFESLVYRIHTHPSFMIQSAQPLKVIPNQPISDIKFVNEKLYALGSSKILIAPAFYKYLECDHLDGSIRLCLMDNSKPPAVFENMMHVGHITCFLFADLDTLITAGSDAVICFWKYIRDKATPEFVLKTTLRGHLSKILSLAVSRAYSFFVTGGEDHVAIIWDLNKRKYVRTLRGHDSPVTVVAINDNTGDIATCSSTILKVWSINGDLLFTKSVSNSITDPVLCCAFYEGKTSEVFDTYLIFTGHKKGHIKIWTKQSARTDLQLDLKLVKTLEQHTNPASIVYLHISSNQRFLLSGDSIGRVFSWMLPDGGGTEIHYSHGDSCLSCNLKFSVLERKLNCKCCGGIFCVQCMDPISSADKLCLPCSAKVRSSLIQKQTSKPI